MQLFLILRRVNNISNSITYQTFVNVSASNQPKHITQINRFDLNKIPK